MTKLSAGIRGPLRRTRSVFLLLSALIGTLAALFAMPAAASADPWIEENPGIFTGSYDATGAVRVDPLGNFYLTLGEDLTQTKTSENVVVREPGAEGGYSSPQPVGVGAEYPDYSFDALGNTLWSYTASNSVKVVERSPGRTGTFGTPKTLETANYIKNAAVGMAPNGAAVVAWSWDPDTTGNNNNAVVRAAVRAPGAAEFSDPQDVATGLNTVDQIGGGLWAAVIDSDGSAAIVWSEKNSSAVKQAVRPAGPLTAPDFGSPTTLIAGTAGQFAEGNNGEAVITYFENVSEGRALYARKRQPGGGFGPAQLLTDDSVGDDFKLTSNPFSSSVAPDGAAAVSWVESRACPDLAARVHAAFSSPSSAGFGAATTIQGPAGSSRPDGSSIGLAANGRWATGWETRNSTVPCGPGNTMSYFADVATSDGRGDRFAVPSTASSEFADSIAVGARPVGDSLEGLMVWFDDSNTLNAAFLEADPTTPSEPVAPDDPGGDPDEPGGDPDEPGDPDGPGDPGNDTTAPEGSASKKGKAKAGKTIKLKVSSDEDGEVVARGIQKQTGKSGKKNRKKRAAATATATVEIAKKKKLKVKLKTARAQLDAGQTKTLKLKPKGKKNKRKAKKLKKAVKKKGAKAKAKIKVKFTDEAGNTSKEKLSFKLK